MMAGQQISVETAYNVYRDRASELFHENALLRAQAAELEARVKTLEAENEKLRDAPQAAPQALSCVEDALP